MEVEVHRGRGGLAELEERWKELLEGTADRRLIHTYEWHRAFLEAQEPRPSSALFATISFDGSLQAILPLRPRHRTLPGPGRRPGLELPLNPHVPFIDIIARDPAAVRASAPAVLRGLADQPSLRWDYITFRRTLTGSNAARSFSGAPGCVVSVRESGHIDYLSLSSYDSLFSGLSSHFRNNLRRARKRADELGEVTYHTATAEPDCEILFREFLVVEASGWKGPEGTGSAIALDEGLRRFYLSLLRSFAPQGRCRIDVMHHRDRPIAAAFHLVLDGTVYGLKIGFDEAYARIAPGNLLHWYIIRTACEDPRLKLFNMASDAAWHSQWQPRAAPLFDISVFRPGFAGRLARFEQGIRAEARHLRTRVIRRYFASERGRHRLAWPWRHRT